MKLHSFTYPTVKMVLVSRIIFSTSGQQRRELLWILLQEARWVAARLANGTYERRYRLRLENTVYLPIIEKLRATGYTVTRSNEADEHKPGVWGDSEIIYIDPKTGMLIGGQDQRHHFGEAAGY